MIIKLNYPKFWYSKNWISTLLIPFSWIYRGLGIIRGLFQRQIRLPGYVICVGNMSVGGTGKTQAVIWLASLLKKRGINVVIISKGYGSKLKSAVLVSDYDDPLNVGDEAMLLNEYGMVIASPTVTRAIPLLERLNPSVIIVDDGMQNSGFFKDFTILTIDPLKGNGNGLIFPAGPLREDPRAAISRADLVLMIGNKECKDTALLDAIKSSGKPFHHGRIKKVNLFSRNKGYIAFTGIGNPEKFFSLLREYKIKVVEEISYPDHYNYPDTEIQKLTRKAQQGGYALITTRKDYVKIPSKYDIQLFEIKLDFENESEITALFPAFLTIYDSFRRSNSRIRFLGYS